MENKVTLSTLGHTWILDLDGTIVLHNGYKSDEEDSFLAGAEEFLNSIPKKDMIIFLTSRDKKYRKKTIKFLKKNKVRYNYIIFNAPYGERILLNDDKPSGLHMSISICTKRNEFMKEEIIEDISL